MHSIYKQNVFVRDFTLTAKTTFCNQKIIPAFASCDFHKTHYKWPVWKRASAPDAVLIQPVYWCVCVWMRRRLFGTHTPVCILIHVPPAPGAHSSKDPLSLVGWSPMWSHTCCPPAGALWELPRKQIIRMWHSIHHRSGFHILCLYRWPWQKMNRKSGDAFHSSGAFGLFRYYICLVQKWSATNVSHYNNNNNNNCT